MRCVERTALDAVRRERQRQAKARRPKGARSSGQHAAWRPELYRARHRLLKARERLNGRSTSEFQPPLA
jgi:hypothetical protein